MVGPPFDELSCFVAMNLRIRWPVAASSAAPRLVTSTPGSYRSFDPAAVLTVKMPGRRIGTAVINRRSVSGTISWSAARQLGQEDARSLIPYYHSLGVGHYALINEAMNPALKQGLEELGVKFTHPAHKLFSQEGGISCA
jgi:hypothetical protein